MTDPLEHIRQLAQGIGPRPSTGEGERKAAAYARDQLEKFGYLVKEEHFRSPSSFSQVYIPILVLALMGFAANALQSPAFALLLTGVALVCFVGENTTALKLVSAVVPKASSQNVVARLAPRELPRRRLVMVAHLDSTRSGLMWHPRLVKGFRATFLLLALCLAALPLLVVARSPPADGCSSRSRYRSRSTSPTRSSCWSTASSSASTYRVPTTTPAASA